MPDTVEIMYWPFETWTDGHAIHSVVGSFRPNAHGLHDMMGNQLEWCREYYRSPYTRWIDPGDGYRNAPGGTASRIQRGGSWKDPAYDARSSHRASSNPETVGENVGLRAARAIHSD